ncbi:icl-1, partial [Symbiodinium necroappetens]
MGGKVLVSTQEHIQRLIAIRLQADVLNSPLVLVARTDAEAATMIDSNIDPVDHPHIKGATVKGVESLYEAMRKGTDKDWEMLAYNLSPSFNWDTAGMTDAQMESFIWDLAKLGFCWQFITLAGFHCD